MFEGISACIFDMDGTILDSMGMWGQIDIDFMASRHLAMPDHLQQDIEGLSMSQTAEWFIHRFHLTDAPEDLMREWNNMARDEYRYKIALKPHADIFLDHLKACGIHLAIATSNSRELVEASYEKHHLAQWFQVCITADEISLGKPAPDVYLEAAHKLKIASEECLVFEDIIPGIQAGHNAGMKVVAVEDRYSHEIADEKKRQADWFIEDYEEADRILMKEKHLAKA